MKALRLLLRLGALAGAALIVLSGTVQAVPITITLAPSPVQTKQAAKAPSVVPTKKIVPPAAVQHAVVQHEAVQHPAVQHPAVQHAAVRPVQARVARHGSRTKSARSYYDYYDAREIREGLYQDEGRYRDVRRQAANSRRQSAPHDGDNRKSYDDTYDNSSRPDSEPPLALNGRDFNGGVGYGQNGDMGYQGGYGRPDPRNGNFDRNGGAMSNEAAARFSVWHGYNSHRGLGNGY